MLTALYIFLGFFSILLATYLMYFVYNRKARCKNKYFYLTTCVQLLFLAIGFVFFLKTQQSFLSILVGCVFASFGLCIKFSALNEWAGKKTKVLNSGVYSLVRHPMYVGNIITYFGLSLILSVYGFLLLFIILPAFVIRGKIEDKQMNCTYSNYKRKVSGFIPSI